MSGIFPKDGRWIILLSVAAYLVFVAVLMGPFHAGRVAVLQGLGVPAMEPLFGDTMCIAHWCDGYGRGEDPRSVNFKDPAGKVISMNYPPVVLGFHHLGMTAGRVVPWGILMGLVFLASAMALSGRCSLREGAVWSVVLLSPSVVMAVERGNLDCLIFGLLTVFCLTLSQPFVSGVMVLAGTLLKIYPMAAVAAFVLKRKPNVGAFTISGLACLVAAWAMLGSSAHTAGDLGQISCCFGSKVVAMMLAGYLGFQPALLGLFFQGSAVVFLLTAVYYGWKRVKGIREGLGDHAINAFWTGIPVYLLVFLSGNQADYKMIMGIFAVPAMLEWIRSGKQDSWIPKAWLLLFFLYTYWLFFSDEGSLRNLLLRQMIAWGLFLVTAAAAGTLLPSFEKLHTAVCRLKK